MNCFHKAFLEAGNPSTDQSYLAEVNEDTAPAFHAILQGWTDTNWFVPPLQKTDEVEN